MRQARFAWAEIEAAVRGRTTVASAAERPPVFGVSTDTRSLVVGDLFVALYGPHFDGHQYVHEALKRGAVGVVVERGRASFPDAVFDQGTVGGPDRPRIIEVEDTLGALGRIGHARRMRWGGPVVAVTGSFGKTTTKSLIAHLLAGELGEDSVLVSPGTENNFIGVPRLLARLDAEHRFCVVELGASVRGEISHLTDVARPTVAVITGVGAAHLEGFVDLDGVEREKLSIAEGLADDGILVVPADDPRFDLDRLSRRLPGRTRDRIVTFGLGRAADVRATGVEAATFADGRAGMQFAVDGQIVRSPLLGTHNVSNVLAAMAACRALGVSVGALADSVSTITPVPGRLCPRAVTTDDGGKALLIDDSYNANPPAMRAAFETLRRLDVRGKRIAVVGEMKELGEGAGVLHREVGKAASDSGIDVLWAIGPSAIYYLEGFGSGMCQAFERREDAAAPIRAALHDGDAILVKGSRAAALEKLVVDLARPATRNDAANGATVRQAVAAGRDGGVGQ